MSLKENTDKFSYIINEKSMFIYRYLKEVRGSKCQGKEVFRIHTISKSIDSHPMIQVFPTHQKEKYKQPERRNT